MVSLIISNSTSVGGDHQLSSGMSKSIINLFYFKRNSRGVILQLQTCISFVQGFLSSLLFLFLQICHYNTWHSMDHIGQVSERVHLYF